MSSVVNLVRQNIEIELILFDDAKKGRPKFKKKQVQTFNSVLDSFLQVFSHNLNYIYLKSMRSQKTLQSN